MADGTLYRFAMTAPAGSPPLQLRTLEDVIAYCNTHEGAIQQLWTTQLAFNTDMTIRMRVLERRVLLLAAGGGLLGASARDILATIIPAAQGLAW